MEQPINRSEHEAQIMLALAKEGVSAIDLFQIWNKIDEAQRELGPLSDGQKSDLILDNFAKVCSARESHMIVRLFAREAVAA